MPEVMSEEETVARIKVDPEAVRFRCSNRGLTEAVWLRVAPIMRRRRNRRQNEEQADG